MLIFAVLYFFQRVKEYKISIGRFSILLHIITKTFFEPGILDTQLGLENFLHFIGNAPDD